MNLDAVRETIKIHINSQSPSQLESLRWGLKNNIRTTLDRLRGVVLGAHLARAKNVAHISSITGSYQRLEEKIVAIALNLITEKD